MFKIFQKIKFNWISKFKSCKLKDYIIKLFFKIQQFKMKIAIKSLAKVSDWSSFQNNTKIFESLRNLYPNQTVSFRSNPKKFSNPKFSEPFRNLYPNQTVSLFRSNSKTFFNPKFSESFRNSYANQTVSFRSDPKKFFNPNQSEAHSKSFRTCNPHESGQSKLIRINPNLQSEWIRSVRINQN